MATLEARMPFIGRFHLALLTAVVARSLLSPALAQRPSFEGALEAAKRVYETEVDELGSAVVDVLTQRREQRSGNRERRREAEEVLAAFTQRGVWPEGYDAELTPLRKRWTAARSLLARAYDEAAAQARASTMRERETRLVQEKTEVLGYSDAAPWISLVDKVSLDAARVRWHATGKGWFCSALAEESAMLPFQVTPPPELVLDMFVARESGEGGVTVHFAPAEGRRYALRLGFADSPGWLATVFTGKESKRLRFVRHAARAWIEGDGLEAVMLEAFALESASSAAVAPAGLCFVADPGVKVRIERPMWKQVSPLSIAAAEPQASGGASTGASPSAVASAPQSAADYDRTAREKAVLDGLRWLVRHQNTDGSWGAASLAAHCTLARPCADAQFEYHDRYDEGLTAMALLCFLRCGFSDESKQDIVDTTLRNRHRIGDVVKSGLQWLTVKQNGDGSFSKDRAFMYNEALAALALVEAYSLKKSIVWKEPAQKAIDFLQRAQKPNPSGNGLWGWRYASRAQIEADGKSQRDEAAYLRELYDADTSVSAWAVIALTAARRAGLTVAPASLDGALAFCSWVTPADGNGLVGYLDPKTAGATIHGPNDSFVYHPTSISALGMCIRMFLRDTREDPFLAQAAKLLVKDLPVVTDDELSIDYYYWHYGSLALAHLDGPASATKSGEFWKPWDAALAPSLLALQDDTERVCSNGGWVIGDRWSYAGGPIYSTAINVLTLTGTIERK